MMKAAEKYLIQSYAAFKFNCDGFFYIQIKKFSYIHVFIKCNKIHCFYKYIDGVVQDCSISITSHWYNLRFLVHALLKRFLKLRQSYVYLLMKSPPYTEHNDPEWMSSDTPLFQCFIGISTAPHKVYLMKSNLIYGTLGSFNEAQIEIILHLKAAISSEYQCCIILHTSNKNMIW